MLANHVCARNALSGTAEEAIREVQRASVVGGGHFVWEIPLSNPVLSFYGVLVNHNYVYMYIYTYNIYIYIYMYVYIYLCIYVYLYTGIHISILREICFQAPQKKLSVKYNAQVSSVVDISWGAACYMPEDQSKQAFARPSFSLKPTRG